MLGMIQRQRLRIGVIQTCCCDIKLTESLIKGFSLHYRTPVGPLRLDYGLPLKRAELRDPDSGEVETDPDHIWHFSLGHAF